MLKGGKKSKEHRPLTTVEAVIALVFIMLCVLLPLLTLIMRIDAI